MTKLEFIKTCVLCGYASKRNAIEYAEGKDSFGDKDLQEVFRINERENDIKHGILSHRSHGDGDYLIKQLADKPEPWDRDLDLNRGLREDWEKVKEGLK